MLYEPPKTKQHIIIIGAVAAVLAVLAIAIIPLLYKNKAVQVPADIPAISQQQKIQKESQKLDQIREGSGTKDFTPEEIDQQSKKLDELRNQMVK